MRNTIGFYKNYLCFRLRDEETPPRNKENLYFASNGGIYFNREEVGDWHQEGNNIVVDSFDEIRVLELKVEKEKPIEKSIPVPKCVANSTTVGEDGVLKGTDKFFAEVARDIQETLKGVATWTG